MSGKINEASGSGVFFMGRFLIKDMISSIDVVLSSFQSNCGSFEGSHFFPLAACKINFLRFLAIICIFSSLYPPWESWFPLNVWLDVFHWFLKICGHFLFKYIASAPGTLYSLSNSNYRYLNLFTISYLCHALFPFIFVFLCFILDFFPWPIFQFPLCKYAMKAFHWDLNLSYHIFGSSVLI